MTKDDDIKVLSVENQTHIYEKLIDFVPEIINKVKLMSPDMLKKKTTEKTNDG